MRITKMAEDEIVFPQWATLGVANPVPIHKGRRYMFPPGSAHNPVVVRDHAFRDITVMLGDAETKHALWSACTFERSWACGDTGRLVGGCRFVQNGEARTADVMPLPGTRENPIVFHRQLFLNMRVDMHDTHARFTRCVFVDCRLYGMRNAAIEAGCDFRETLVVEGEEPFVPATTPGLLVFHCAVRSGERAFGTVESDADPDFCPDASVADVLARHTVFGKVRARVAAIRITIPIPRARKPSPTHTALAPQLQPQPLPQPPFFVVENIEGYPPPPPPPPPANENETQPAPTPKPFLPRRASFV